MRKLMFLLSLILLTTLVVACQNNSGTTTTTKTEPVVVKLAHWGIGTEQENNLWRRRVARFNETHDDIKIEIVMSEGGWDEWLTTKASAGELPDVFLVNSVPDAAIKGWAANIYDIVKNDAEWFDVPKALRDTVTYFENRVYGIPAGYHFFGYYANFTLFENANVTTDFSTYNFTVEEFFAAITQAKYIASNGTSTVGLDAAGEIVNWLPSALDETGKIKHFLWDGEKFDYMSTAMTQTIEKAVALMDSKEVFGAYSEAAPAEGEPSEREVYFGTKGWNEAFANGRVGFRWGGSWDASYYANNISDFDHDFVGLPGNRVVGVSDYFVISKTAKNKEAAYEVAKWLSFGYEGIAAAFDIIEKEKEVVLTMPGLPINERTAVIEKWFESYPQPGFKTIFEKTKSGEFTLLMEGNKYVPGFDNARWHYDTGIDARISRPDQPEGKTLSIGDLVYDASNGKINWSDYMTQELANKINQKLTEAINQLRDVK
ncbi:MAG: extracellular solute-binding protein [Bacilli bacterium]|nr:extracellular solute-binding protein [Bacilli bacterium]